MPALAIPAFWYAVAGTATAAGAIGAAKIGSNAQNRATDASVAANSQALDFEKQQAAADQQRFDATQHANYDQWASRQSSLSSLQQMAGLGPRVIPPYVNTSTPAGATPQTAGAPTMPGSDPQSALLSALNSGQKGQAFVDQFNKQFNLQPGSSLAYYPDTNTYSLAAPNGYAAVGANGQWNWNPRSGGASSAAPTAQPGSLASLLYPNVQTPAALAVRTPALYQPGSLGSYV